MIVKHDFLEFVQMDEENQTTAYTLKQNDDLN